MTAQDTLFRRIQSFVRVRKALPRRIVVHRDAHWDVRGDDIVAPYGAILEVYGTHVRQYGVPQHWREVQFAGIPVVLP